MKKIIFPGYFPEGAKEHVRENLAFYRRWIDELNANLKNINAKLRILNQFVSLEPETDEDVYDLERLQDLRDRRGTTLRRLGELKAAVDLLVRLVRDPLMRGAYELLSTAFAKDAPTERDRKVEAFVSSAWRAAIDFSAEREHLKKAKRESGKIAKRASQLAELLREIDKIPINMPRELAYLPDLLRRADNVSRYRAWRAWRGILLGNAPNPQDKERDEMALMRMMFGSLMGDQPSQIGAESAPERQGEVTRAELLAAWSVAPDVPELMDAIANAARDFQPSATGFVGAAIASQRRDSATEYVRAFANLLVEEHHFAKTEADLSAKVRRAITITTAVVTGHADTRLSPESVGKALKQELKKKKPRTPRE